MQPVETTARRRWMGILAKAPPEAVMSCWSKLDPPPAYELLRRPEIGLVMVRGRVGGDGAPFNLGEMTVTRCSVRLEDGTVGHAWITGRVGAQAEQAAVLDAVLQGANVPAGLEADLTRLEAAQATRRSDTAHKAAATRVDFFTMVRGEN
jgi:alpha-D-ribose 1-methylphosphonate 5-triphosphate synthase subunit PhnG